MIIDVTPIDVFRWNARSQAHERVGAMSPQMAFLTLRELAAFPFFVLYVVREASPNCQSLELHEAAPEGAPLTIYENIHREGEAPERRLLAEWISWERWPGTPSHWKLMGGR